MQIRCDNHTKTRILKITINFLAMIFSFYSFDDNDILSINCKYGKSVIHYIVSSFISFSHFLSHCREYFVFPFVFKKKKIYINWLNITMSLKKHRFFFSGYMMIWIFFKRNPKNLSVYVLHRNHKICYFFQN